MNQTNITSCLCLACLIMLSTACADDDLFTPAFPNNTSEDATTDIVAASDATRDQSTPDQRDASTEDVKEDLSDEDMSSSEDMVQRDVTEDMPPVLVEAPCEENMETVRCAHETKTLWSGLGGVEPRDIHWAIPKGIASKEGWPVVILFQGSLFSSERSWSSDMDAPFGGYHQVLLIRNLLEAGFAVLTPEAHLDGSTYWDTNIFPWNFSWETSNDHRLMVDMFEGIENGDFGMLDPKRLYATGISSGGYMTSRMAVSYEGKFRALAIQSASYATCAGVTCWVPSLPEDHPPTLFLHGGLDLIVPAYTMEMYYDDLKDAGIVTRKIVNDDIGHEWIPEAPEAITDWFVKEGQ